MPRIQPAFITSPFFVDEPGNWHLKDGAPKELQEEFEEYMESLQGENIPGAINGIHISYPYDE